VREWSGGEVSRSASLVIEWCQVGVYSDRGSSQVWTKADEGRGQGAGQEASKKRMREELEAGLSGDWSEEVQ